MTTSTLAPAGLTARQVEHFDREGYLVLRDHVPADPVRRLRDASRTWMSMGRDGIPDGHDPADWRWADHPEGRTMFRVDYLHSKGRPESLELLGSPHILGVARSLFGRNLVPTYESLVFKDEGDGAAVPWHQDAVHPRRHRIANIDVYLDESRRGHGALRIVPRSQIGPVDVCRLQDEHGWSPPGVVEVEMAPGDVLVHDVMVVHGSERTTGSPLRRTLYYEFRAAEQILAEGPWDAEWVDARLRLVPLALRAWQATHPGPAPIDWDVADRFRPRPLGDDAAELRVAHGVHSPGSHCSAGSVAGPPSA
ncbi:MAG: phytanoyl-CoA dioxygenase family protein [Dermatophilaceae bacterium]